MGACMMSRRYEKKTIFLLFYFNIIYLLFSFEAAYNLQSVSKSPLFEKVHQLELIAKTTYVIFPVRQLDANLQFVCQ
jgi:hypothetical protein